MLCPGSAVCGASHDQPLRQMVILETTIHHVFNKICHYFVSCNRRCHLCINGNDKNNNARLDTNRVHSHRSCICSPRIRGMGKFMISVGTKSLLVGAHQFLFHPVSVALAWRELYGVWPTWKEAICIFIHDGGYWGCPNIDGPEGEEHPHWAAEWAVVHLDGLPKGCRPSPQFSVYPHFNLCLFHSRSTARKYGQEPSKLCWADKLALKYDPWWTYLPRVILSGEIHEFRKRAADFGEVPLTTPNIEWYQWARKRMMKKAYERDARPAFQNGS